MDFFSRQRAVPDWNQALIEQQRALVLGVGAIGCSIARNLCRLGITELTLVDCDVVSVSNVNRQVLFSCEDVGRRKVEAACDGLQRHNIRTKITAVHFDAVAEWRRVVEIARTSTVVFNCIDYGEYYDYAVASLCVSLSIPYISASSYGHSAIAECYPPTDSPRKGPCWGCNNAPSKTEVLQQITPDQIQSLGPLSFLPRDSHMPSTQDVGSSILPCTLGATLATGGWINSIHGYELPHWASCDFASLQMFSFAVEPSPTCLVCAKAPLYSREVLEVYFGRSEVKMVPVKGDVAVYSKGSIENTASEAQLESSRRRIDSCGHLGPEYAQCFVPAIPTADLVMSHPSTDCSSLPDVLQTPLLKTLDGPVTAIRSGNRSAILPTCGGCYRLKGCGNFVDVEGLRYTYPGFPLEKMEAKEGVEIKGCCFEHTALTEQYMSDLIRGVLQQENIPVGNTPLAVWRYAIPEDPLPKVVKCCGVFETLGERRLASHLLPGLQALLPLLFPSLSLQQALALFPEDRLTTTAEGERKVQPTWSVCCVGGKRKVSPINMCLIPLEETPPTQCPEGIPPELLGAWCKAAFTLRQNLPLSEEESLSCGSLLAALHWALGWEVGVVKRILETNQINWGYFFDHNPFEPHCNAHPNNFVILPPGQGKLIAPVDFDLSFTPQGFFSPYTGAPDSELFASWLDSEHSEMERALGGEKANSGVAMVTAEHTSLAYQALSWAYCDTLLSGYRCGYEGRENLYSPSPRVARVSHVLVRMALIVSESNTT